MNQDNTNKASNPPISQAINKFRSWQKQYFILHLSRKQLPASTKIHNMLKEEHIKYLITNEQDVSWGIVTTTVGYQDIPPQSVYPPQKHPVRYLFSSEKGRILNEYQLVYITRGRGSFTSSHQKNSPINSGDIFLLFPGEWHTYRPDLSTGWYEYWIGFTGKDIDAKIQAGFFKRESPIIRTGFDSEIVRLFQLAVETAKQQSPGFQQMLAGIVNLLLGYSYAKFKNCTLEGSKFLAQINKAKVIMREHIFEELSGTEIAKEIGMSYSSFRRFFKQCTGFSPAQYFLELKINKSKELLTNSELNCQEIAFEMGFNTPSYFNLIFQKKTGMTPYQFRRMTQGKDIPAHPHQPTGT